MPSNAWCAISACVRIHTTARANRWRSGGVPVAVKKRPQSARSMQRHARPNPFQARLDEGQEGIPRFTNFDLNGEDGPSLTGVVKKL